MMALQILAAAVGTVAFAVLFSVPNKYYIYCGITGAAGWMFCSLVNTYTFCTPTEATFFATIIVVLLSRYFAVWEKCPVTVFLISGIFPLVPGAGIYWAAYYLVTNQISEAVSNGFAAVKAAVAIVLGIVVVFELPYRMFQIRNNKR